MESDVRAHVVWIPQVPMCGLIILGDLVVPGQASSHDADNNP